MVRDASGKVVRRMPRVPDEPGVNRVSWDLRYDPLPGGGGGGNRTPAAEPTGAAPDTSLEALRARRRAAAEGGSEGPNEEENPFAGARAPFVLPGTYTVAMTFGGREFTKTVKVEHDPRSDMTATQIAEQHDAGIQVRDLTMRVNQVVSTTDDMVRQLTSLQTQMRRSGGGAMDGMAASLRQNQTRSALHVPEISCRTPSGENRASDQKLLRLT